MTDLTILIGLLKAVEADDSITPVQYLTDGAIEDLPELVQSVVCQADSDLINSNGSCNWEAHRALEQAGYKVFAGEKDSFGWLTGCIRTSKGVVVYG